MINLVGITGPKKEETIRKLKQPKEMWTRKEGICVDTKDTDWLKEVHDQTLGAQNRYDGKYSGMGSKYKPHTIEIDKTKQVLHMEIQESPSRTRRVINIGGSQTYARYNTETEKAIGVANIEVYGKNYENIQDKVKCIEFEVGGARWDKIYKEAMGCFVKNSDKQYINFWYLNNGRGFPLSYYHAIQLYIDFEEEIEEIIVKYDIVVLDKLIADKILDRENRKINFSNSEIGILQWQYLGREYHIGEKDGFYRVRCGYNHPITKMYVTTTKEVNEMRLNIGYYELEFEKIGEKEWRIDFTKEEDGIGELENTLNASRCDIMEVLTKEDPGEMKTWTQNFHHGRIMGGLAGLSFTK